MSRWTLSKPHPTKVNISFEGGEWIARSGDAFATAPVRVERGVNGNVFDFGKFDALEKLCTEHPGLWDAGYVVLEQGQD